MNRTTETLNRRKTNLLEFALALGGFSLGASEFASMGLLPDMAKSSGVTISQAGSYISAYAIGAILGAPVLTLLAAKMTRKWLLLITMALVVVGNLTSALSTEYENIFIARLLSGLPHGAYFGVAGYVVASAVPVHSRARAISRFMLGITLSVVVGTPLATYLGHMFGWQFGFIMVCLMAFLTLMMILCLLPDNPDEVRSSPQVELLAMKSVQVWLTLGIAAIGFAGMFCIYSFLVPALTQITRLSNDSVPLMLMIFGIGTVAGNVIGGRLCDRYGFDSVGMILAGSAVSMLLFPMAMQSSSSAAAGVFLVGCLMALAPALQVRLLEVASEAPSLAAASNHAAFNIANAIGPWLGGISITAGFGWTSTGYIGSIMAVGGLTIWILAKYLDRKKHENPLSDQL